MCSDVCSGTCVCVMCVHWLGVMCVHWLGVMCVQ